MIDATTDSDSRIRPHAISLLTVSQLRRMVFSLKKQTRNVKADANEIAVSSELCAMPSIRFDSVHREQMFNDDRVTD